MVAEELHQALADDACGPEDSGAPFPGDTARLNAGILFAHNRHVPRMV
jgi:hypothetical protein